MANQRNGGPGPGDFTGREKQKQAKDAQQSEVERSAEMSMAGARQEAEERVGVFDGQSGERLDGGAQDAHTAVLVEESPVERSGFFHQNEEPTFTGKEAPEEVEPALAARRSFVPPDVNVAQTRLVKFRVESDVEDMTYGMNGNGEPNNYTFREGLTYSAPREVAEHLNERGLVRQWM